MAGRVVLRWGRAKETQEGEIKSQGARPRRDCCSTPVLCTMSSVEELYDVVQQSAGADRQRHLHTLSDELAAHASTEALLLGLRQPSSDVRRLVLEALLERPSSAVFLSPTLDTLRLNLKAPNSSLSAIRSVSSALKVLSHLLKGGCPLATHDAQGLVDVLLTAMAWGLTAPVGITRGDRKQWRSGPGAALAFEGRGSQSSSWRGTTTPLQKKSSSGSLSSEVSSSSTALLESGESALSDGEHGTEDEGERRGRRLQEARRSARQRSVGCLCILNDGHAKLLLIHWPRVLLDAENGAQAASLMDVVERDDSVSNRVTAVHAIQSFLTTGSKAGFMAGAEERSRLSAFTSLSGRTASIVVDIRSRLLAVLADASTPSALLEATLKCTRTLVLSTPQVKLRQSHSQTLREMTLRLCARPDVASAVPAYSLLSALVASERRGVEDSAGDSIVATLQGSTTPTQVQIEAWNTMTALADRDGIGRDDKASLPPLLQRAVCSSTLELRQAAANFVQACRASKTLVVDEGVVEQLHRDVSPIVRSIAANCLVTGEGSEACLIDLMHDSDSTVRAAAVRAVGVKMQSTQRPMLVDKVLRLLRDDSLFVRMRASWTLGNLCEVGPSIDILAACFSLKDDDERVAVNAVRGVGALLATCAPEELQLQHALVDAILTWLSSALTSGGPKLRWNVTACLARAVTQASTGQLLLSLDNGRLIAMLSHVLIDDDTFKVRLPAVEALATLVERRQVADHFTVALAVQEALTKVQGQVKQASFREAQLHALPLQESLRRLLTLLSSDGNLV